MGLKYDYVKPWTSLTHSHSISLDMQGSTNINENWMKTATSHMANHPPQLFPGKALYLSLSSHTSHIMWGLVSVSIYCVPHIYLDLFFLPISVSWVSGWQDELVVVKGVLCLSWMSQWMCSDCGHHYESVSHYLTIPPKSDKPQRIYTAR